MLTLTNASFPEFYEELLASVLAAFRNVIIVCEWQKLTLKCETHLETEKEFKIILHWVSFSTSDNQHWPPPKKEVAELQFLRGNRAKLESGVNYSINTIQNKGYFPPRDKNIKMFFFSFFAEEFAFLYL